MIKKIMAYIEQRQMIQCGDTVVMGVSGGADSVALFLVLVELKKKYDLALHVVHINHLIRKEAGEDEQFVADLCKRYDVPFHVVHEDVEAMAKEKHLTTEEAGRLVRYEAFYQCLRKYAQEGHGKIAVAHNKNDSAETVLFHLFRGSGIQGLTGIAPVREEIIRPLLCVERAEIEAFLLDKGQSFCTDRTNFTDDYARNRIRHHILAYATEEVCQGAITHTQEAAEKIAELCGLIERLSDKGYKECVRVENDCVHIQKEKLYEQDNVLHSYIVIKALSELVGTKKDIASIHIESILTLFSKQVGRQINLPYGYLAIRDYDGIKLCKDDRKRIDEVEIIDEIFALEPEENLMKEMVLKDGSILEYGIFAKVEDEIIPQKTYTKWFDYDKIKGSLSIRKRAVGDYLVINDKGQKQALKSYFINEKIPRDKRDEMSLLACESHILWIIGERISHFYKVSGDTKRILKVNLRGGAHNG